MQEHEAEIIEAMHTGDWSSVAQTKESHIPIRHRIADDEIGEKE